jgi:DNA-binding MarR family transcriptional regulator
MTPMTDVKATSLPATLTFRLGMLGTLMTERFSATIEPYGLKPKHVGMMAVLDTGGAASQLEVARTLRVAPSLVVTLADHLEALGAIQRIRDPEDRRRQILTLTDHGRELLGDCLTQVHAIEAELTAVLTASECATVSRLLASLAAAAGLPLAS